MKLKAKIAFNTIIQIASKLIATLVGLISIGIITRHLGSTGFGEYTTIITFLSFFGIVADLGLTLITVQMISQPGIDEKKVLGNLLGLRLVSALFFIGLAPIVVLSFPYSAGVKAGVLIASLSFIFVALNQILVGLFQKNLRMDKVSIAEITSRITLLFFTIMAVKLSWGLNGILLAMVLSSGISFILHYIFSRKFVFIQPLFDFNFWKKIIRLSWPLALTIFFNLIYLKSDTIFLSIIPRPSEIGIIAEVGIYGAAYKVIDVLITLPFMFSGIILPILSKRWAEGDKEGFNYIMQKSFDLMAIFAIPIAVGAQFVSRDIMVLVAGEDFSASGAILKILIIAASLIFLGNISAHAIIAINKQKKIIGAYIFVAITALIGYLVFIPYFSYFGAAAVTIYSELAIALASIYLIKKYTDFVPSANILIKAFLASFLMGACIYLTQNYIPGNVYLALMTGVLSYGVFIYLLKGIRKEDVMDLMGRD